MTPSACMGALVSDIECSLRWPGTVEADASVDDAPAFGMVCVGTCFWNAWRKIGVPKVSVSAMLRT